MKINRKDLRSMIFEQAGLDPELGVDVAPGGEPNLPRMVPDAAAAREALKSGDSFRMSVGDRAGATLAAIFPQYQEGERITEGLQLLASGGIEAAAALLKNPQVVKALLVVGAAVMLVVLVALFMRYTIKVRVVSEDQATGERKAYEVIFDNPDAPEAPELQATASTAV